MPIGIFLHIGITSVCWSTYSTITWLNFASIVEQRNDTTLKSNYLKKKKVGKAMENGDLLLLKHKSLHYYGHPIEHIKKPLGIWENSEPTEDIGSIPHSPRE